MAAAMKTNKMARWSRADYKLLIKTLIENPQCIIKQSGCLNYTILTNICPIFLRYEPLSVRDKVKQCMRMYEVTVEWIKTNGSGKSQQEFNDSIQIMCPDFDQLNTIFGPYGSNRPDGNEQIVAKTEELEISDLDEPPPTEPVESATADKSKMAAAKRPRLGSFDEEKRTTETTSNDTIQQIFSQYHERKLKFMQRNLAFKEKKHRDRMALENKRLDLERRKFEHVKKMQQLEIENKHEMAIMELQHKYKT